jgi:hypothetical protein
MGYGWLMWPNAWLAFATMCVVVTLMLWGAGRLILAFKLQPVNAKRQTRRQLSESE